MAPGVPLVVGRELKVQPNLLPYALLTLPLPPSFPLVEALLGLLPLLLAVSLPGEAVPLLSLVMGGLLLWQDSPRGVETAGGVERLQ